MNDSSPRGPGRPRSDVSRAALLDAAYWQVSQLGYFSVTAEAIARAAGAGKQTLYRWWPSKARLVLEAFSAKARERIDRPRDAALRAGEIDKFLALDLAALRPFADALRGLLHDAAADPELMSAIRVEILAPRLDALRSLLKAHPEGARDAWAEAIEGAIFRRLMLGEPLDDAFAKRLAGLLRL